MEPETIALLKQLGPVVGPLAVVLIGWLELRLLPIARRGIAQHRAVTRKVGVTDADVAAELEQLRRPSGGGAVIGG